MELKVKMLWLFNEDILGSSAIAHRGFRRQVETFIGGLNASPSRMRPRQPLRDKGSVILVKDERRATAKDAGR